jgi:ribosomal-protein-alanine N-acetyltransferase
VEIETARLLLRPFTPEDGPALARLYADPAVTRYLPHSTRPPAERAERVIRFFADHWARHGFGVWAVVEKATGEVSGHCGLNDVPEVEAVEVLYALVQSAWGRGIATEAAAASIRYGFETVGLERIVAFAAPENTGSRRVMEKIGLCYAGDRHIFGLDTVEYILSRNEYREISHRDTESGEKQIGSI